MLGIQYSFSYVILSDYLSQSGYFPKEKFLSKEILKYFKFNSEKQNISNKNIGLIVAEYVLFEKILLEEYFCKFYIANAPPERTLLLQYIYQSMSIDRQHFILSI